MRRVLLVLSAALLLAGCAVTRDFSMCEVEAKGYAAPDIMFYHKDVNGWANPAVSAGFNARAMFGVAGVSAGLQVAIPLYMPFTVLGHDHTDWIVGTSAQIGVPFRVKDDDVGYWTIAPVFDIMSYTATKDAGLLSMGRGMVSLGVGVEWDARRYIGDGDKYLWANCLLSLHFRQFHTLTMNNATARTGTGHIMFRLLPRFGMGFML